MRAVMRARRPRRLPEYAFTVAGPSEPAFQPVSPRLGVVCLDRSGARRAMARALRGSTPFSEGPKPPYGTRVIPRSNATKDLGRGLWPTESFAVIRQGIEQAGKGPAEKANFSLCFCEEILAPS